MVRVNKETSQQQVLRSKLYMNSIKKERNQSIEVLDSLIFWGSLHFVDKNGNLAKSKNIMPNYSCAPFLTHQVSKVGVTKINLASLMLQSTKKSKNF